jgi:uncharacterized protein (TIGR02147 family)
METQTYYITKIKEDLSLRQRSNPQYSLRAYARHVGMHPSTLSQVIKGNRPLPLKDSIRIVEKMNLGPKERTLFMESLLRSKTNIDKIEIDALDERFMLDESYYKVIAEWEHYAVLDLFELKSFEPTLLEVSQRLGITENRASVVVNTLITSGLLTVEEDGSFKKVHADIRTTEDVKSQALKDSHKETMKMGIDKIDEIEVELRDFSATTVALDLSKLPEAKTIIREFRQKMAALLRDGEKTDVYQLAIQFYPLTQTTIEKN